MYGEDAAVTKYRSFTLEELCTHAGIAVLVAAGLLGGMLVGACGSGSGGGGGGDGGGKDTGGSGGNAVEAAELEERAEPHAFAAITVHAVPNDSPLALEGELTVETGSADLEPQAERVVVAVGSKILTLEAGAIACVEQDGATVCTYKGAAGEFVQELVLGRTAPGSWTLRVAGGDAPAEGDDLFLRVGNDWGGVHLAEGTPIYTLEWPLDETRRAAATIGPDGGWLWTQTAEGVFVSLSVPKGALQADTEIAITPLGASPVVDPGASHFPGVHLSPDGLVLAVPANLTMDFSGTAIEVAPPQAIFQATSPMTAFPLASLALSSTGTISASISHFSDYGGGGGSMSLSDLTDWADSILSAGGQAELGALLLLEQWAALQMALGCTTNCIDLSVIADGIKSSIEYLVGAACPLDIGDPSEAALERWVMLEALAQQHGVAVAGLRDCIKQVLDGFIDRASTAGQANPTSLESLDRLVRAWGLAQQLGFSDLQQKAKNAVGALLGTMIAAIGAAAASSPDEANLGRLHFLYVKAGQLGFPDSQSAAVVRLAVALRALLGLASSLCNSSAQAGLDALDRLDEWMARVPAVQSQDPALSSDAAALRGSCNGPGPAAAVVPAQGTSGSGECKSGSAPLRICLKSAYGFWSGKDSIVATDTPAPVVLNGSMSSGTGGPSGQAQWSLTQTGPHAFAISVNGSLYGGSGDAQGWAEATGYLSINMTFPTAGTLTLTNVSDWLPAGLPAGRGGGGFANCVPPCTLPVGQGVTSNVMWNWAIGLHRPEDPQDTLTFGGTAGTLEYVPTL